MKDKIVGYDDIIELPHPVSTVHSQMPVKDRAAQFAPFSALTGHAAAVRESSRLTQQPVILDEDRKMILNKKIQMLKRSLCEQPEITVTFFRPDDRKEGGAYISVTGYLKKIDDYCKAIILTDGTRIPVCRLYEIESQLLHNKRGF